MNPTIVDFSVVKQKLIKTDIILQMHSENSHKLKKALQSCKDLKQKLERTQLENERCTFSLESLKTKYDTMDADYKSLYEQKTCLEQKYNQQAIATQKNIQDLEMELQYLKELDKFAEPSKQKNQTAADTKKVEELEEKLLKLKDNETQLKTENNKLQKEIVGLQEQLDVTKEEQKRIKNGFEEEMNKVLQQMHFQNLEMNEKLKHYTQLCYEKDLEIDKLKQTASITKVSNVTCTKSNKDKQTRMEIKTDIQVNIDPIKTKTIAIQTNTVSENLNQNASIAKVSNVTCTKSNKDKQMKMEIKTDAQVNIDPIKTESIAIQTNTVSENLNRNASIAKVSNVTCTKSNKDTQMKMEIKTDAQVNIDPIKTESIAIQTNTVSENLNRNASIAKVSNVTCTKSNKDKLMKMEIKTDAEVNIDPIKTESIAMQTNTVSENLNQNASITKVSNVTCTKSNKNKQNRMKIKTDAQVNIDPIKTESIAIQTNTILGPKTIRIEPYIKEDPEFLEIEESVNDILIEMIYFPKLLSPMRSVSPLMDTFYSYNEQAVEHNEPENNFAPTPILEDNNIVNADISKNTLLQETEPNNIENRCKSPFKNILEIRKYRRAKYIQKKRRILKIKQNILKRRRALNCQDNVLRALQILNRSKINYTISNQSTLPNYCENFNSECGELQSNTFTSQYLKRLSNSKCPYCKSKNCKRLLLNNNELNERLLGFFNVKKETISPAPSRMEFKNETRPQSPLVWLHNQLPSEIHPHNVLDKLAELVSEKLQKSKPKRRNHLVTTESSEYRSENEADLQHLFENSNNTTIEESRSPDINISECTSKTDLAFPDYPAAASSSPTDAVLPQNQTEIENISTGIKESNSVLPSTEKSDDMFLPQNNNETSTGKIKLYTEEESESTVDTDNNNVNNSSKNLIKNDIITTELSTNDDGESEESRSATQPSSIGKFISNLKEESNAVAPEHHCAIDYKISNDDNVNIKLDNNFSTAKDHLSNKLMHNISVDIDLKNSGKEENVNAKFDNDKSKEIHQKEFVTATIIKIETVGKEQLLSSVDNKLEDLNVCHDSMTNIAEAIDNNDVDKDTFFNTEEKHEMLSPLQILKYFPMPPACVSPLSPCLLETDDIKSSKIKQQQKKPKPNNHMGLNNVDHAMHSKIEDTNSNNYSTPLLKTSPMSHCINSLLKDEDKLPNELDSVINTFQSNKSFSELSESPIGKKAVRNLSHYFDYQQTISNSNNLSTEEDPVVNGNQYNVSCPVFNWNKLEDNFQLKTIKNEVLEPKHNTSAIVTCDMVTETNHSSVPKLSMSLTPTSPTFLDEDDKLEHKTGSNKLISVDTNSSLEVDYKISNESDESPINQQLTVEKSLTYSVTTSKSLPLVTCQDLVHNSSNVIFTKHEDIKLDDCNPMKNDSDNLEFSNTNCLASSVYSNMSPSPVCSELTKSLAPTDLEEDGKSKNKMDSNKLISVDTNSILEVDYKISNESDESPINQQLTVEKSSMYLVTTSKSIPLVTCQDLVHNSSNVIFTKHEDIKLDDCNPMKNDSDNLEFSNTNCLASSVYSNMSPSPVCSDLTKSLAPTDLEEDGKSENKTDINKLILVETNSSLEEDFKIFNDTDESPINQQQTLEKSSSYSVTTSKSLPLVTCQDLVHNSSNVIFAKPEDIKLDDCSPIKNDPDTLELTTYLAPTFLQEDGKSKNKKGSNKLISVETDSSLEEEFKISNETDESPINQQRIVEKSSTYSVTTSKSLPLVICQDLVHNSSNVIFTKHDDKKLDDCILIKNDPDTLEFSKTDSLASPVQRRPKSPIPSSPSSSESSCSASPSYSCLSSPVRSCPTSSASLASSSAASSNPSYSKYNCSAPSDLSSPESLSCLPIIVPSFIASSGSAFSTLISTLSVTNNCPEPALTYVEIPISSCTEIILPNYPLTPAPSCTTSPLPCLPAPSTLNYTPSAALSCPVSPKSSCPASPTPNCAISPIPNCTASPTPSCRAFPMLNCTAAHTPSCPTSPTPSCPASHTPSCPVSHTPSCPASPTPSCPASPTPSCPASPTPSCPASPTPSCPTSHTPSCSVSHTPSCPASPMPSCPTSPAPSCPASPTPSCPASPDPSGSASPGLSKNYINSPKIIPLERIEGINEFDESKIESAKEICINTTVPTQLDYSFSATSIFNINGSIEDKKNLITDEDLVTETVELKTQLSLDGVAGFSASPIHICSTPSQSECVRDKIISVEKSEVENIIKGRMITRRQAAKLKEIESNISSSIKSIDKSCCHFCLPEHSVKRSSILDNSDIIPPSTKKRKKKITEVPISDNIPITTLEDTKINEATSVLLSTTSDLPNPLVPKKIETVEIESNISNSIQSTNKSCCHFCLGEHSVKRSSILDNSDIIPPSARKRKKKTEVPISDNIPTTTLEDTKINEATTVLLSTTSDLPNPCSSKKIETVEIESKISNSIRSTDKSCCHICLGEHSVKKTSILDISDIIPPSTRKRKKKITEVQISDNIPTTNLEDTKINEATTVVFSTTSDLLNPCVSKKIETVKRGRGRPRKCPKIESKTLSNTCTNENQLIKLETHQNKGCDDKYVSEDKYINNACDLDKIPQVNCDVSKSEMDVQLDVSSADHNNVNKDENIVGKRKPVKRTKLQTQIMRQMKVKRKMFHQVPVSSSPNHSTICDIDRVNEKISTPLFEEKVPLNTTTQPYNETKKINVVQNILIRPACSKPIDLLNVSSPADPVTSQTELKKSVKPRGVKGNDDCDILSKIMSEMDKEKRKEVPNTVIRDIQIPTGIDEKQWRTKLLDMAEIMHNTTVDMKHIYGPKPTKKKRQGILKNNAVLPIKIDVLLKKLLSIPNEDDIPEEIILEFKRQTSDEIIDLVIYQISKDIHDKPDNKYYPAPLMTRTQRIFLCLLVRLGKEKGFENIIETCFSRIQEHMFRMGCGIRKSIPLTRLFLSLCRLYADIHRIRTFCCEAFFYAGDLAIPIFFIVLTSWIDVLPHATDVKNYPIAKLLVQLVHLKTCGKPGYNLFPLRCLLNQYYGYPKERWNCDEVFVEFYQMFLANPSIPTDYAIRLFCKNKDTKWVYKKINEFFKPLIYKIPEENVNFKATTIILMGKICRMFKPKDSHDDKCLTELLRWFEGLLEDNSAPLLQQSIQYTIQHLPKKGKKPQKYFEKNPPVEQVK